MPRFAQLALAALLAASPAAGDPPACRSVVVTGDPDYPPFSWSDEGKLRGAAVTVVTSALDRIGLPYEVRDVGPFTRVLYEAAEGRADVVVELSFEKLSHRRIDYFVVGYYPGIAWLTQHHRESEFKGLRPFVTESDNYVGWSKAGACIGRLPDFDAALAKMVRTGEVRRAIDASIAALRPRRR